MATGKKNSDVLGYALGYIRSTEVRRLVRDTLDIKVSSEALSKWAASTGKYHPMGMDGSMETVADHTIKVVLFVRELLANPVFTGGFTVEGGVNENGGLSDEEKDLVYAAAILHDCAKYGLDYSEFPQYTLFSHPLLVRELYPYEKGEDPASEALFSRIADLVASHEGIWTTSKHDPDVVRPLPASYSALLLHQADFLASRNNVMIYRRASSRGLWTRLCEAVRGWFNEKVRYADKRNPKRSYKQAGRKQA